VNNSLRFEHPLELGERVHGQRRLLKAIDWDFVDLVECGSLELKFGFVT